MRDPSRWNGEITLTLTVHDGDGPRVGATDLFRAETERALRGKGVRVHWVESLFWSHLAGGEVHCATNALRDTSGSTPWWRREG
ncbi:protein-arginine deiminase family protein [Streptomyces sp. NBC_01142]|uniref:protein-arginine deiminase family protein n=1 Tax=Streptomyces sp. NBC_01142 TaxID=2975865 RepID=UPI00224ED0D0|nr:protein-arginine deiminase family protein [Streptomyces sp. NBC_01142]